MATTDINGMVFYGATDIVTPLQNNFNGISTAVTNALNGSTRTFRVANQAARDALLTSRGASAANPLQVDRADTGQTERNITGQASGWKVIVSTDNTGVFTPAVFGAGWGNYENFGPVGWTRDSAGIITWQGLVKRTGATFSAGASGTIIEIPTVAQPSGGVLFNNQSSSMGVAGFVRVNFSTTVNAQNPAGVAMNWAQNEYISLTGISYKP